MTSTGRKTLNISVIIPVLNEEHYIARTVQAAASPDTREVIVVDGGSCDATISIAAASGAKVLSSSAGRATQMNAGAEAATGEILLFLHGDTLLPDNFSTQIIDIINRPATAAGAFRFAVDLPGLPARVIEMSVNWRAKTWQLPYGDQAIFLKRHLFKEIGAYDPVPILEDVILIRKLKKRARIRITPGAVITSGRRWRKLGILRTTLINQKIMLGYLLFGLSPQHLKSWYRVGKK